jgi:hypothetical protein
VMAELEMCLGGSRYVALSNGKTMPRFAQNFSARHAMVCWWSTQGLQHTFPWSFHDNCAK